MRRAGQLWERIPVRLRVAVVLSVVLAVVLAASGYFVYARMASELDATVDQGLRSRTGDLTALVEQADSGLAQAGRSPLTEKGESFAQILTPQGRVVDAPPNLRQRALLTPGQLRAAAAQPIVVRRTRSPLGEGSARLRATPVRAQGRKLIVLVGATLEQRDEALRNLGVLLLLVGAVALALASLAGYAAVRSALRPVELMRRRASGIQTGSLAQRLPVPPSGDELTRLGETLNQMLDRLEAGFAHERAFVDDASHELRSPLAILKGELDLAIRDASTVDDFRASVAAASEEADRVVGLAEDLLILARADQGQLSMEPTTIDSRELLDVVALRFAQQARAASTELTVDVDGDLSVRADEGRLTRALANTVENALRHSDGRITLSARRAGDMAELRVTDS